MQGKVALRSAILNSTDEQFLLSQIASLCEQIKAGSGFARHILLLLASNQIASVRDASRKALQDS